MNWIINFGRFWYDFIVGDSAVLAVGGVAVLVIGWALARSAGDLAATILLPLVVIATLAASLAPFRR